MTTMHTRHRRMLSVERRLGPQLPLAQQNGVAQRFQQNASEMPARTTDSARVPPRYRGEIQWREAAAIVAIGGIFIVCLPAFVAFAVWCVDALQVAAAAWGRP